MVTLWKCGIGSPPQQEEGWLRDQEKSRSFISSCRRGGVVKKFPVTHHHPVRSIKGSFADISLDVAATPPGQESVRTLKQTMQSPGTRSRLGLRSNLIRNLDTCAWPGGVAAPVRRKCEASEAAMSIRSGQTGWWFSFKNIFRLILNHHPVRSHQRKLRDISLDVVYSVGACRSGRQELSSNRGGRQTGWWFENISG